jgi:hypothetical protein
MDSNRDKVIQSLLQGLVVMVGYDPTCTVHWLLDDLEGSVG